METNPAYIGAIDVMGTLTEADCTMTNSTILTMPTTMDFCGTIGGSANMTSANMTSANMTSANMTGVLGENDCMSNLTYICKFIYHENSIVFFSKNTSMNSTVCDSIENGQLKTIKDFRSQALIKANIDLR